MHFDDQPTLFPEMSERTKPMECSYCAQISQVPLTTQKGDECPNCGGPLRPPRRQK